MATEQQLREQYELDQKKLNLSQQQIEDAFRLSQRQSQDIETQTRQQATQLAQQSYISKAQTERVMPNVLSAQGLSNTGYENVRKGQVNTQYQGQQSAIQSDLNSNLSSINRQREKQELNRQQNLASLELQRESASLDYRYALQSLQEQLAKSRASSGSGSSNGSSGSYSSNGLLINQYGSLGVEQGELTPDKVDAYTQQYVDAGYITQADKQKLDNQLKTYAYTVNTGIAPITIPTVTPTKTNTTPVKKAAPSQNILKKALVIGQW